MLFKIVSAQGIAAVILFNLLREIKKIRAQSPTPAFPKREGWDVPEKIK